MVFSVERTSPNHNVQDIVDVTAMGKEVKYSYYLHFLYTRPVYQNYNLQKATNTNRGNIDGVCLVLATKDINTSCMHVGLRRLISMYHINQPMRSERVVLLCVEEKNTH